VQFIAAAGSRRAVKSSAVWRRTVTRLVRALALSAERTSQTGVAVRKPRLGVYEPWGGNMSAGWIRWILEQCGFDFVTLRPGDFHTPLTGDSTWSSCT
jgi:hypothetical protein